MRSMDVYNAEISKLAERVARLQTVGDSAIALINGLRERINQLVTESDGIVPTEELQKLSSSIDVGTQALAAAVAANTVPGPQLPPDEPTKEQKPAEDKGQDPAVAQQGGD